MLRQWGVPPYLIYKSKMGNGPGVGDSCSTETAVNLITTIPILMAGVLCPTDKGGGRGVYKGSIYLSALAATIYHLSRGPRVRPFLRKCDYAACGLSTLLLNRTIPYVNPARPSKLENFCSSGACGAGERSRDQTQGCSRGHGGWVFLLLNSALSLRGWSVLRGGWVIPQRPCCHSPSSVSPWSP